MAPTPETGGRRRCLLPAAMAMLPAARLGTVIRLLLRYGEGWAAPRSGGGRAGEGVALVGKSGKPERRARGHSGSREAGLDPAAPGPAARRIEARPPSSSPGGKKFPRSPWGISRSPLNAPAWDAAPL